MRRFGPIKTEWKKGCECKAKNDSKTIIKSQTKKFANITPNSFVFISLFMHGIIAIFSEDLKKNQNDLIFKDLKRNRQKC